MKKVVFGLFAVATFGLASCGEKLLTDAEVAQQITAKYEAGKAAVEQEMDAKCTADFDARVEAEAQRIVEDTHAAQAAEKEAAESLRQRSRKK